MNKEIIICFKKKDDSPYNIKSEYWFAIVDAINRTKNVKIFPFNTAGFIFPPSTNAKTENTIPRILEQHRIDAINAIIALAEL